MDDVSKLEWIYMRRFLVTGQLVTGDRSRWDCSLKRLQKMTSIARVPFLGENGKDDTRMFFIGDTSYPTKMAEREWANQLLKTGQVVNNRFSRPVLRIDPKEDDVWIETKHEMWWSFEKIELRPGVIKNRYFSRHMEDAETKFRAEVFRACSQLTCTGQTEVLVDVNECAGGDEWRITVACKDLKEAIALKMAVNFSQVQP